MTQASQTLSHVQSKTLSHVQLFVSPWTVAYQAPPSMGFSRQEYWSGLPFPSPGDLPDSGIEPRSPALQADALPFEPPGRLYLKLSTLQTEPTLLCGYSLSPVTFLTHLGAQADTWEAFIPLASPVPSTSPSLWIPPPNTSPPRLSWEDSKNTLLALIQFHCDENKTQDSSPRPPASASGCSLSLYLPTLLLRWPC